MQPLFYKKAEPLDFARHQSLGVRADPSFEFARTATIVMLTASEFALASRTYPIVFSTTAEPMPIAILGVRKDENLFVRDGKWTPFTYIPAYIRRYPFVFFETPEKDKLILCVDVDADAVQENGPTKFFEASGDPSEFTKKALEFCRTYQMEYNQTRQLHTLLQQRELLVTRQAEITTAGGGRSSVTDFQVVDEAKLNQLPDEVFLEFRKAGILPLLYFHLMSLLNFKDLADRASLRA